MDDIEKRIELKNLEIKKLRLEQELSNLSNDSYQEPQKRVVNNSEILPNDNREEKIRAIKKTVLFIIFCLVASYFIFDPFNDTKSNSSTTSSSSSNSSYNSYKTKTCEFCGKEYSTLGWFNLYGQTEQANEGGLQEYCSYTCARRALDEINRGLR